MRILARLILSLEKLIKNPVSWFDKQPWLYRFFLVFFLIPLISVISIAQYEKLVLNKTEDSLQNSNEQLKTEIFELKQEIVRLYDVQMEELAYISADIGQIKKSLVSENSEDLSLYKKSPVLGIENVSQKLKDASLKGDDVEIAYVKTETDGVDVFISPSETAKKLTTLEVGSFYPALRESGDWQQIDLRDGQFGWIKKEFIIKFPVNENY